MKFEKHAFISYAHIDNQPISDEDEGWISNFHALLQSMVSMKLGEKVKIWRDNKLRGSDIFSDEIVDQFPDTAIFISVITPRYINSEWCTKEIKEFYKSASKNVGLSIENKSRILKVVKTPVERKKMPEEIVGSLGYEFYKVDENGRPKEFNKIFGEEYGQAYLSRLDDLAYDIQEIINLINDGLDKDLPVAEVKVESLDNRRVKTIYVAHTSYDLVEARDQLVRELKTHNYRILPSENLPILASQLVDEVNQAIDEADFSIHLVGKSYGAVPDGPDDKSAIMIQNDIAAQKSHKSDMPRIIWVADTEGVQDNRQQQFITSLNENKQAQIGAEIIEGSLDELKIVFFDKINQIENKIEKSSGSKGGQVKKVFLICDAQDRKATIPLRKYLKSKNVEVTLPLFDGEPSEIRIDTEENLKTADAILLFYGEGDEFWKRSKTSEIKKMSQNQRDKPLLASYIYLAHPDSGDKLDMIEMEEDYMINGMGGFSEDMMSEFLAQIDKVHA